MAALSRPRAGFGPWAVRSDHAWSPKRVSCALALCFDTSAVAVIVSKAGVLEALMVMVQVWGTAVLAAVQVSVAALLSQFPGPKKLALPSVEKHTFSFTRPVS